MLRVGGGSPERPMTRRAGVVFTSLTGLWLVAAVPARAQIVVVPTFPVAAATDYTDFLQDVDVAANGDGSMVFIWGEYNPSGAVPTTR